MADDDDEIAESLESVRIERDRETGEVLLQFGEHEYRLSEDDCMVLSRGLNQVALNNPPALTVHFETDERSAHLEYD